MAVDVEEVRDPISSLSCRRIPRDPPALRRDRSKFGVGSRVSLMVPPISSAGRNPIAEVGTCCHRAHFFDLGGPSHYSGGFELLIYVTL